MHALPGKRYFVKKIISEEKLTKDIPQRNNKKKNAVHITRNGNENRKTNVFSLFCEDTDQNPLPTYIISIFAPPNRNYLVFYLVSLM
jgi:hypothetical protein